MGTKTQIEIKSKWSLLSVPLLFLAAVFLTWSIWLPLFVMLGGLFSLAFYWVYLLRDGITVRRDLRRRLVAVGDRLEERFEVTNSSWVPIIWMEIADHSNVPGYNASVARSVEGQQIIHWVFSARCMQRGHFHVGPWELETGDPFGIFRLVISYPVVDEVVIHPPIHTELAVRLPAGRRSGGVRGREKALQATINAASVRAYRPQDPLRWIHWLTSARRGEFYVREFDLDAAGDIWLILDFYQETQLGEDLQGTEEHAVLLAASLSSEAIMDNRAAGLAVYAQRPFILPPATGEGQQWQILQALALLRADGDLQLKTTLVDAARVVHQGTAVVIITPDLSGDWLPELHLFRQKGVEITVVLFDRETFGGRESAQSIKDEILRMGFDAHIIHQGEVGRRLYHLEEEEIIYKVTPMGKVIAVRGDGHG